MFLGSAPSHRSHVDKDWKPAITIRQILLGIQDLLDNPNNNDPAQGDSSYVLKNNPAEYKRKIRAQAQKYTPKDE